MAEAFIYDCPACELEVRAEAWETHELPRLYCPECGGMMAGPRRP